MCISNIHTAITAVMDADVDINSTVFVTKIKPQRLTNVPHILAITTSVSLTRITYHSLTPCFCYDVGYRDTKHERMAERCV
jgi:hypothetical protein